MVQLRYQVHGVTKALAGNGRGHGETRLEGDHSKKHCNSVESMTPRARKLHKGERERTGDDDPWRCETKAASNLAGENLVAELQEVCNGRGVGCGGDDVVVRILGGLTLAAATLWKAY
jgi:hypothetical protein